MHIEIAEAKRLRDVGHATHGHGADFWFPWLGVPAAGITVRLTGWGRGAETARPLTIRGSISHVARWERDTSITPAWTVTGRQSVIQHRPHSMDPNAIVIQRPQNGDRIAIRCTVGTHTITALLWIIKGEIRIRNRGTISPASRNHARRSVMEILRLPSVSLGLFTSPNTADGTVNYGALVEIVGVVAPPDVPARFHLVRKIITTTAVSNAGPMDQRGAGEDDTSSSECQDTTLSHGKVYDLDAPGSWFSPEDAAGTEHTWNVLFAQLLVIGELPAGPGAWAHAEENHLSVSPPQHWRAHYRIRLTTPGRPPTVRFTEGEVGEALPP